MRIGILGGVFNPPHLGHLVCAQEALVQLGLDRVLFVPVGDAPHRSMELDPGAEMRVALCAAAVAGDDRFQVSRLEVDREGPSYTVDTLRALGGARRGAGAGSGPPGEARAGGEHAGGAELVLILGGDQAAELRRWRDPEDVLSLASVAVTPRGQIGPDEVRERLVDVRGRERVGFFTMPRIDVSSTLIRERVAEELPIRYLVPEAVRAMITACGLYRAEVGTQ